MIDNRLWNLIKSVDEEGKTSVVDSFYYVFFLNKEECQNYQPIIDAFSLYFKEYGSVLNFYVDKDGYTMPLPEDPIKIVKEQIIPPSTSGEMVNLNLLDHEYSGNQFEVEYYNDPNIMSKWPNEKSFISFRISHDTVLKKGIESVVTFFTKLAELLPFSFGYASPALSYGHNIKHAIPYTRRFPGLDILDVSCAAIDLGNNVAGIYWLSALGPTLTNKLGEMHLREMFSSQIEVISINQKGIMIRLGSSPETGDISGGIDMPQYYELANVLKPYLHIPQIVYTNNDKEEMICWHNRFLNDQGEATLNPLMNKTDDLDMPSEDDLPF